MTLKELAEQLVEKMSETKKCSLTRLPIDEDKEFVVTMFNMERSFDIHYMLFDMALAEDEEPDTLVLELNKPLSSKEELLSDIADCIVQYAEVYPVVHSLYEEEHPENEHCECCGRNEEQQEAEYCEFCELNPTKSKADKPDCIKIDLYGNTKLVAEKMAWDNSFSIYIEKNGEWFQDLATVCEKTRLSLSKDNELIINDVHGVYEVSVYGDDNDHAGVDVYEIVERIDEDIMKEEAKGISFQDVLEYCKEYQPDMIPSLNSLIRNFKSIKEED